MQKDRPKPFVLAVDDEEHITELIAMALGFNGFEVQRAATGREALAAVQQRRPDLILLDVMLPDLDGCEVARRLRSDERAGTRVPVLFLTARDATADKVEGLRLGGGRLRDQAVLDRGAGRAGEGSVAPRPGRRAQRRRQAHLLRPRRSTRTPATSGAGGRLIELTPTEYRLLHYLLSNSRRVLTREQILEAVWDYTFAGNASVLETYISYLRHKIDGPDEVPLLHTVRGVGCSLRLPAGTEPA